MDIDLSEDFKSTHMVNFVFEGEVDTAMFERFYTQAIVDQDRPFQLSETSFYQGGKCSDILKYFKSRPIQLGTTWIFVLDNDKAANKLRAFIESRYKDFMNKYIFVFQYARKDMQGKLVEIEDLLPENILSDAITKSTADLNDNTGRGVVEETIDVSRPFDEYLTQVCNKIASLRKSVEGKRQFKSRFKSILNSDVAAELESIKSKDEMKKHFPEYTPWALSVVEALATAKKKLKAAPKVAQAAPGKTD